MPKAILSPDTTNNPATWEREVRRFIEAGGNTTHAFGLGRLIGRMFALLYLQPRPLSLEEIAARLEISKASASTTIRHLEQWHAVRHKPVEGDRRDYYEAETEFRVIVREGLLPGIRKKLGSAGLQISRTLEAEAPAVGAGKSTSSIPADIQIIRKRLRAARDLHAKLDGILSSRLLEHFL
jgi:DNA-binding transcriptional regulator GbsR (MarR family)